MNINYVFSWAENSNGEMVHVDSVPRGQQCGCICPCCHENLLARHGDVREHGFAHHSDNRGANLNICYEVTLYKLAEQIIKNKKKIHTSSYYDIFPATDIYFVDVKINSYYNREDKQPDVIAITEDGKQYLIEFTFNSKVQHKEKIDYKNLTCLEIDIANQTLESLESFLLASDKERKWLNNQIYFKGIEEKYRNNGKKIKVVEESICANCKIKYYCCGVKQKNSLDLLVIEHSGKKYRLCKQKELHKRIEKLNSQFSGAKLHKHIENDKDLSISVNMSNYCDYGQDLQEKLENIKRKEEEEKRRREEMESLHNPSDRTCFECRSNLVWANKNGYANCGAWKSLNVPQKTPPTCAKTCKNFKRK